MAVTKAQALEASVFHADGGCTYVEGPRGGIKSHVELWRRNGQTKTWKTRPNDFRVPIKHGLYAYDYVVPGSPCHIPGDCPIPELRDRFGGF